MNEKRDLAADLAMCEKATKGPWELKTPHERFKHSPYQTGTFVILAGEMVICHWEHARTTGKVVRESEANGNFIAAAREGWPYAIRRAMEAEDENSHLCEKLSFKEGTLDRIYAKTERLWQWARENLTGEISDQFWQISANGSLMHENPKYQQRINLIRHENERLKAVLQDIYPALAGRVIHLQAAGEERAAAEWEAVCQKVYAALEVPADEN